MWERVDAMGWRNRIREEIKLRGVEWRNRRREEIKLLKLWIFRMRKL